MASAAMAVFISLSLLVSGDEGLVPVGRGRRRISERYRDSTMG
jgi:hypothetical protein